MTAPTLPGLEPPPETLLDGLPVGLRPGGPTKPGTCPQCAALVLAGYDSHVMAHLAIVDPARLTPQLDAAAFILERPTWVLHGYPGQWSLANRTWPGVNNPWPVHTAAEYTVVTDHQCGKPLGGEHIPIFREPLPIYDSAEIPF